MSKHGDRYFDGYERRVETDENGKTHKKLVYVGQWYGYERPGQQKQVKGTAALLTAVVVFAYLYAQLNPSDGGMNRYMAIPSLLSLVPLMFMVIGLANLLPAKEKWELRTYYAGFLRLYRWSIGALVLLALWVVMEVVFIIMNPGLITTELVYLLFAAVSVAAQTVLVIRLKNNKPVVVEGPQIR